MVTGVDDRVAHHRAGIKWSRIMAGKARQNGRLDRIFRIDRLILEIMKIL